MNFSSPALLRPESPDDLARSLAAAHQARQAIRFPDLRALSRILAHVPEDLTVTVQGGLTLSALQAAVAQHGQWIPIDPPDADNLSIAALLAFNQSGPRRYGYGGIRDHLIGVQVALADGRLIRSGGQVVKNVAGFDLMKLFIGDHGSLGIVVEATFKLLPKPRSVSRFIRDCEETADVDQHLSRLLASPVTPVAIDFYQLPAPERRRILQVTVEGMAEDVAWQADQLHALGYQPAGSEDWEARFWAGHNPRELRPASVLPSRLGERLATLGNEELLARAGSGIVYARHLSAPTANPPPVPNALALRVKEMFDPHAILPGLPA